MSSLLPIVGVIQSAKSHHQVWRPIILSNLIVLTHCQGAVSVFAGSEQGSCDGIGTKSNFNGPTWLAVDQETDNLFVSDTDNHTIRRITPQGEFAFVLHHPHCLLK